MAASPPVRRAPVAGHTPSSRFRLARIVGRAAAAAPGSRRRGKGDHRPGAAWRPVRDRLSSPASPPGSGGWAIVMSSPPSSPASPRGSRRTAEGRCVRTAIVAALVASSAGMPLDRRRPQPLRKNGRTRWPGPPISGSLLRCHDRRHLPWSSRSPVDAGGQRVTEAPPPGTGVPGERETPLRMVDPASACGRGRRVLVRPPRKQEPCRLGSRVRPRRCLTRKRLRRTAFLRRCHEGRFRRDRPFHPIATGHGGRAVGRRIACPRCLSRGSAGRSPRARARSSSGCVASWTWTASQMPRRPWQRLRVRLAPEWSST